MRTIPGTAGADELPQWSKGYRVVRLPVPPTWDGRTLRELDCRARFGVSVLAVEAHDKPGHTFEVPDPDRRLDGGRHARRRRTAAPPSRSFSATVARRRALRTAP